MFFREAVPQGDAMPGAVIAIQTLGDLLGFNPPCPVLCTNGCFDEKALFRVAPRFGPEGLKAIFEHKVFRMLLCKGKSTPDLITLLRSWRHSGFQVYAGPRIQPGEEEGKVFCRVGARTYEEDTAISCGRFSLTDYSLFRIFNSSQSKFLSSHLSSF